MSADKNNKARLTCEHKCHTTSAVACATLRGARNAHARTGAAQIIWDAVVSTTLFVSPVVPSDTTRRLISSFTGCHSGDLLLSLTRPICSNEIARMEVALT